MVIMYDYSSFFTLDFYHYDGNFFVVFSPLLMLAFIEHSFNLKKYLKIFFLYVTILNILCILKFYLTGYVVDPREQVYFFLFTSHNAAGGFLSFFLLLFWGINHSKMISSLKKQRLNVNVFLFLVNLFALIITTLEEILAFIIVMFVFFFRQKILYLFFLSIFIFTMIFIVSSYYSNWDDNGKVLSSFEENSYRCMKMDYQVNRIRSFEDRFCFLWPRAYYLFSKSPLYGTGFGSYNDVPYVFDDSTRLNVTEYKQYNSAHAHNTYLHVLAETGIAGLSMLIFLLIALNLMIKKISWDRDLRMSFYSIFWYSIFSSFTEHRLFTIAQMIPFTLILGIAFGYKSKLCSKDDTKSII